MLALLTLDNLVWLKIDVLCAQPQICESTISVDTNPELLLPLLAKPTALRLDDVGNWRVHRASAVEGCVHIVHGLAQ